MTTVRMKQIRRCSLVLLALATAFGALAEPAEAARPPIGRTYYTIAMGLETGYDVRAECFEFHAEKLCTLDGLICGSWLPTAGLSPEMGLSFDLTTVADGELMQLDGLGRLDTRGNKSSIAGTGRFSPVDGGRSRVNFSFAGREVGKTECLELLEDSPGGDDQETVIGSGITASEERDVSDFRALLASGVGLIEIRHGPTESLRITADDNLLPILTSEVSDGRLILGSTAPFRTNNDIRYEITVRDFDDITVAGVFGVDITGLDTDRFTASVSGVSGLTVAGRVDRQEVVIAGVSRYDAGQLSSRTAMIDIAGLSWAIVRVSDLLEGSVVGGATLEYIGNPTINVTVDFLSTLRKIG